MCMYGVELHNWMSADQPLTLHPSKPQQRLIVSQSSVTTIKVTPWLWIGGVSLLIPP
jgi:hypothetical protein